MDKFQPVGMYDATLAASITEDARTVLQKILGGLLGEELSSPKMLSPVAGCGGGHEGEHYEGNETFGTPASSA